MSRPRACARPLFASVALASLLLCAPPARATGALVGDAAGPPVVVEARVALAPAAGSRWVSLRVHGASAPFAWIVPVGPGTTVEGASSALFDALEQATATRVLAPASPPPCSVAVTRPADEGHVVAALVATEVTRLADAAALASFVAARGLALTPALALAAQSLPAAQFVAISLPATSGDAATPTLRLDDDGAARVPLGLARGAAPRAVTTFAFAERRAVPGGAPLVEDLSALVLRADGTSSYASARGAALVAPGGDAWLVEASGPQLFAEATAAGATRVPSLDDAWAAARAAGDDDLERALAGLAPGSAVLTRAAGLVRAPGDDPSLVFDDGPAASPVVRAARWEVTCPAGGLGGASGGGSGAAPGTGGGQGAAAPDPGAEGDGTSNTSTGASLWVGFFDSCASSSPGSTSSSDGCGASPTTGSSGATDSCAGSPSSAPANGDTCGGSSGGSSSNSDTCSGGKSTSDAACSVARRGRPRTSQIGMLVAAALAALRRATRSRRGAGPNVDARGGTRG